MPSAWPGIEFLEYLTPRDGREYPADARANDLLHCQTTLLVGSIDQLAQRMTFDKSRVVSKNAVSFARSRSRFFKSFGGGIPMAT